jgi:hypothetical protein
VGESYPDFPKFVKKLNLRERKPIRSKQKKTTLKHITKKVAEYKGLSKTNKQDIKQLNKMTYFVQINKDKNDSRFSQVFI